MMVVVALPPIGSQSRLAAVHVAFILHALGPGGTERQVTYLTAGLVERGTRVSVVELRRGGHFTGAVERAGGTVISAAARNRADLARVVRIIRGLRPDVAYGLNPEANVLALASGAPAVFGIRATALDQLPQDAPARFALFLQHRLARRARLVVVNSHAGARELRCRGYPGDRLRVVPNGIEVGRFAPAAAARRPADSPQLVATVARMDRQKDHETFLRAAALAARPGRRFAWFGDGPLRSQIERRARELGVELLVPGVQHDMRATYAGIDVFTLSSAWGEGFSNAFAEALAAGLPCVVTDTGDHARAREVATVVAPGDPGALAAAWDHATACGGRAWVAANMSVDQMVSNTHELLLEAVRGR
jgi:glycosyltransferase involved in cell wall biosynthesis